MNEIALSERLTKANRLFLEFIVDGIPVGEAYKKAGYKGEVKNAYNLKLKLKSELAKVLEARGFSREGVMVELNKLNTLPLKEKEITIDQKLRLYKLVLETIPEKFKGGSRDVIQPFVIVKSDNTTIQSGEIKQSKSQMDIIDVVPDNTNAPHAQDYPVISKPSV